MLGASVWKPKRDGSNPRQTLDRVLFRTKLLRSGELRNFSGDLKADNVFRIPIVQ